MEPSSACACMSVLGYDPRVYYQGRAGIEARSMGIPVGDGEVVFRCNLVNIDGGIMKDYSAGHISTKEAQVNIDALNKSLGNEQLKFYPGVSYRHILWLIGKEDTLSAITTPPHDITGKLVQEFLPKGQGSDFLRELMAKSEEILGGLTVNKERAARGETAPTGIWLFWGSGQVPDMPPFKQVYGLKAAMTSGVDLLHGLGGMVGMDSLKISGVTDGLDNDYAAQAAGALRALEEYDLVVIHIEAPDEAAHAGSTKEKVESIQKVDSQVVSRLLSWRGDDLQVLILPDHPTPIKTQTHSPEPVPFILWGPRFAANGASRFTEAEAVKTGLFIDPGYNIMGRLVGRG
jgi:2,3-bisphosphoglycerate-independent phosphoglycerate mutase